MEFGLEVYNAAGEKTLGIDSRCPRLHGTVTIPAIAVRSTVFVSVSGMATDGTWFADLFQSASNVTWAVSSGGITVRNESFTVASSPFTLVIFRG